MSHTIYITNLSDHNQEFEIHGWNNNQNMVVWPHSTNPTIQAADGSSGAIIALHDGHEGEQAEITKCGFGGNAMICLFFRHLRLTIFLGNDFIDISNIMGAGGNLTVQQVGNNATRKGDPNFMQDLNNAWHSTDDGTRAGLQNCVHLDGNGNVSRIDAIKDFPNLEAFVRSFANGMTYIGVGAWGGNPGNPNDNNQSSGGQGSTDIQVTYSDGNANPPGPPGTFQAFRAPSNKSVKIAEPASDGAVKASESGSNGSVKTPEPAPVAAAVSKPAANEATPAKPTASKPVHHDVSKFAIKQFNATPSGPGVIINNHTSQPQTYAFYNNYWNGNGTAGANFDHPDPTITVDANGSTFVSLPTSFKGRVQRGTTLPATWAEFQVCADNDHAAHGDISLEQGCDGAATISATDGSGRSNGFTNDILSGAPDAAVRNKPDGSKALDTTVGNWNGGANQAAIDWENQNVGQQKAYIQGGTGTDDVASSNQCLAIDFY